MTASPRRRRAACAAAFADDPRRAQFNWDDLAAWPDWAAMDAVARDALARRAGAWLHAGNVARCIDGAWLQRARELLGEGLLMKLLAGAESGDAAALAPASALPDWLDAEGRDVLLAAVPSPLLQLALRERFWPQAAPSLRPPDASHAAKALAAALEDT